MAKEYLVEGAMCTCTLGTAPGKFKVTDNDFMTMNGKYTGTINTLGNCFEPPGFGSCNQNPMMPKPCNPSVVQWLDFYDGLKINGSYALLMNSKATCAMGVPNCISFMQSGQIAIPSASQKTQEVAANEQEMNPMAPIEEDQQEEVKITVLIEMPYSKEHRLRNTWDKIGILGHSAMAVGDRFFDYVPDKSTMGQVNEQDYDADFNKDGDKKDILDRIDVYKGETFAPGMPYWAKVIAEEYKLDVNNLSLDEFMKYCPMYYKKYNEEHGTIYKVEFFVNKDDADKMLQWWINRYEHLKIYSVLPTRGEQCTTIVKTVLQIGGIRIPDVTQTPKGLLNDLKRITSTSDKHKGQPVTTTIFLEEY